jgi:hypothetical protein
MDAYFLTNPEVKRFRKTADSMENLQVEMKLLQTELRDNSSSVVSFLL